VRLGSDKAAARVGGLALLDRVLRVTAAVAAQIVVVGPVRELAPGTAAPHWCREDPPGGGPVAGVAAGLPLIGTERVFVLAVDLPFLTPVALRQLAAAGADAVAVDAGDVPAWLLGIWRTAALREAMPAQPAGRSWRSVVTGLDPRRVRLPGDPPPWTDCDSPEDLTLARRADDRARGPRTGGETGSVPYPDVLTDWVARVRAELDLPEVAAAQVLDLARDVAHGVARPAAPLTTFLVGLAAGRDGGDPDRVAAVTARVRAMLDQHSDPAAEGPR